ncbi:MAG: hypothetical protein H7A37_03600 [Chlamydiales bacterium]|nr:hypothetical protein [Chlamydiia bacterium]MCP5507372.1 hypothetical protein [Chlamydiales bacterium]
MAPITTVKHHGHQEVYINVNPNPEALDTRVSIRRTPCSCCLRISAVASLWLAAASIFFSVYFSKDLPTFAAGFLGTGLAVTCLFVGGVFWFMADTEENTGKK